MTHISMLGAAIFIAGWNLASWGPEYFLLTHIYGSFPQLHAPKTVAADAPSFSAATLICDQWIVFSSGWTVRWSPARP